jgi:uncharacterized membrane protein YkoI
MLALAAPVHADDEDHEIARRLLAEGRIKPIAELFKSVSATVPGDVLEVEFEVEHGRYVYEFKILKTDGKVVEVEVDAADGKLLKVEDDD